MKKDKLELDLDELGCGKVILNGKDISSNVSGLMIVVNAGEVPEVTIKTVTEDEINAKLIFKRIMVKNGN